MGIRTLADLRQLAAAGAGRRASGPAPAPGSTPAATCSTRRRSSPEHETKSQSTEITFDVDVNQRAELERHLAELSEELCRRLRKRELEGRTIGIKIRLDDWTNVTRSHTIDEPTNDPEVVGPVALDLLRAYDPQRPVRLLGVRLASFERGEAAEPEPTDGQLRLGLAELPRFLAAAERPKAPCLAARHHRPDAGEAELLLDRLGQVVVAPGDVGAAVDHRHGHACGRGSAASPSSRTGASCWRRPSSPASGCRRRRRRCRRGRARSRRRRRGGRSSACALALWEPRDAPVVDAVGADRVAAGPLRRPAQRRRSRSALVVTPRTPPSGPRKTTLTRWRPLGRTLPRTASPFPASTECVERCRATWDARSARGGCRRSALRRRRREADRQRGGSRHRGQEFSHRVIARFLLPTGLADGLATRLCRLSLRAARRPIRPGRASGAAVGPPLPALGEGTRQVGYCVSERTR